MPTTLRFKHTANRCRTVFPSSWVKALPLASRQSVHIQPCSVLNRDDVAARRLLTDYRHVDEVFQQYFEELNREWPEDTVPITPLQCALAACVSAVYPIVDKSCRQSLILDIDGMSQPGPSAVKLVWHFDDLLGAMYLQMYWILTSGGNLDRKSV